MHLCWLNLPHSPTPATSETSIHRQVKIRESSPWMRDGCRGKRLEKRWVLRREWKTPRHNSKRGLRIISKWCRRRLWPNRGTMNTQRSRCKKIVPLLRCRISKRAVGWWSWDSTGLVYPKGWMIMIAKIRGGFKGEVTGSLPRRGRDMGGAAGTAGTAAAVPLLREYGKTRFCHTIF